MASPHSQTNKKIQARIYLNNIKYNKNHIYSSTRLNKTKNFKEPAKLTNAKRIENKKITKMKKIERLI